MKKENEKGIEKERKGKMVHNCIFFGNRKLFLLSNNSVNILFFCMLLNHFHSILFLKNNNYLGDY